MERGAGRLQSVKSHAELTLDLIKEIKSEYYEHVKANKEYMERDFTDFLKIFEKEFDLLEEVAEEVRVLEARLEKQLKDVGVKIGKYRKKIKKHPNAKPLLQHIDSLLKKIKNIRKAIREEVGRAIREEGWLRRNI